MINMPKNAIWLCFHHQLSKSALETQIKAYAVFANDQHTEKRYLTRFSSSTFEIYSRNAKWRHMLYSQLFNIPKNAIRQYLQFQLSKSSLETQIKPCAIIANVQLKKTIIGSVLKVKFGKCTLVTQIMAFAVVGNVQLPQKRYLAISMSNLEVYSKNANNGLWSYAYVQFPKKHYLAVFTIPTFKIYSRIAN